MEEPSFFDKLFERLPASWQPPVLGVMEKVFYVYYMTKHHFPYSKAKHRIAYHEKYLNSAEYRLILKEHGPDAAYEHYFGNRLWIKYGDELTFFEKFKCLVVPYSVIDRYENE